MRPGNWSRSQSYPANVVRQLLYFSDHFHHLKTSTPRVKQNNLTVFSVPPNVRFIIDNIEDEWEYPDPLDYVFGRMLVGSVGDWPKFIAQSFDNLRSGGWLELQDMVLHPQCIDDSLKEDSFIKKWADAMLDSTSRINRFADSAIHYKQQMIDAGFINVTEVVYKWPTNTWPKNDPYRDIGMLTLNRVYSQQQS